MKKLLVVFLTILSFSSNASLVVDVTLDNIEDTCNFLGFSTVQGDMFCFLVSLSTSSPVWMIADNEIELSSDEAYFAILAEIADDSDEDVVSEALAKHLGLTVEEVQKRALEHYNGRKKD